MPPAVRFAPTNITGFLGVVNFSLRVWTEPAAAEDYAEGHILYVLRQWTVLLGVSMATGAVEFAVFPALERLRMAGTLWPPRIAACRHLNATAVVCAREGDWSGNATLLFYDYVSGTAWRALRHPRLTVLHHDLRVNPMTHSVLLLSQAFVNITHNHTAPSAPHRPVGHGHVNVTHNHTAPSPPVGHAHVNVTQNALRGSPPEGREFQCSVVDLAVVTEVAFDGTVRWAMDLHPILWPLFVDRLLATRKYKCHNPCMCRNVGQVGDFLHPNTIHWDLTEDTVYMSFRHIGTLAKISRATKTVEWIVGHLTGFQYTDVAGNVTPYGFLSLHEPTKVGPNRFLLFDNRIDLWGFAVPPRNRSLVNRRGPCIREILVHPQTSTVQEVFSWCFPTPCKAMGYVQPVPHSHYLGHHSYAGVTTIRDWKNGAERWRAAAPVRQPLSYRAQVFYLRPPVVAVLRGCSLRLRVHDCFYRTYGVPGTVTLRHPPSHRSTVLSRFILPPYWKAVTVVVALPAEETAANRSFLVDVHVEGAAEPTTFCLSPNNASNSSLCGP